MARTDEQIKKDIVDQLYWDSRVDASDIKVEVSGGEVTLSGTAPNFESLKAAENDTWIIPGVLAVNNQMTLEYPSEMTLPSDSEIQSNIRNSLIWKPYIDEKNIQVTVDNHIVKLTGTVDSYWKKMKAEEIAYDVLGVMNVQNELGVVPTRDIVDKIIAQEIMSALDRNIYVDPDSLDVKVEDGAVHVSGTVPNWRAYQETLDTAYYTPGVKSVTDDLFLK